MRVKVEFEFNDKKLGRAWLNLWNLKRLLYSPDYTKEKFLKIKKFERVK